MKQTTVTTTAGKVCSSIYCRVIPAKKAGYCESIFTPAKASVPYNCTCWNSFCLIYLHGLYFNTSSCLWWDALLFFAVVFFFLLVLNFSNFSFSNAPVQSLASFALLMICIQDDLWIWYFTARPLECVLQWFCTEVQLDVSMYSGAAWWKIATETLQVRGQKCHGLMWFLWTVVWSGQTEVQFTSHCSLCGMEPAEKNTCLILTSSHVNIDCEKFSCSGVWGGLTALMHSGRTKIILQPETNEVYLYKIF